MDPPPVPLRLQNDGFCRNDPSFGPWNPPNKILNFQETSILVKNTVSVCQLVIHFGIQVQTRVHVQPVC